MGKGKRSFFERLTGTVSIDEYDDVFEDDENGQYVEEPREPVQEDTRNLRPMRSRRPSPAPTPEPIAEESQLAENDWMDDSGEGQLSVDVYQTSDDIVIRAHVAGVRPDELDVSITRDMVTIKGKREEAREVEDEDYFYKELYWGSFSRTILLPQEIEVEEATANEKHGLLIIRLPKIDKAKQTKLKVKG